MNLPAKSYGDTDFITGMRAYAALAVLITHAGGGGLSSVSFLCDRLVSLGGQGVAVFFVISGYSVSASYLSSRGFDEYIYKRFWRLAPLYYFWILTAVLLETTNLSWQEKNHVRIDAYNLFMHVAFLSSLDYKVAPTLLGVDWTLSIEMIWYFLIPSILLWANNTLRIIVLIFISLIVSFDFLFIHQRYLYLFHWTPLPYASGFLLGVVAFRLRQLGYVFKKWATCVFILLSLALIMFLYLPISLMHTTSYLFFTLFSFVLILFGTSENFLYKFIFTNKSAMFLGGLSYGIYLCHITFLEIIDRYNFVTLPSIKLLCCIALSVTTSAFLYYVLERPFNLLGNKVYFNHLKRYSKNRV